MSTQTNQSYSDDDLVYVDPDTRTVVGLVEWSSRDLPKSRPYEKKAGQDTWRKIYPWGTYRSMKRVYRLEGKVQQDTEDGTLDDALAKFFQDKL